jgi:hypothetical protein
MLGHAGIALSVGTIMGLLRGFAMGDAGLVKIEAPHASHIHDLPCGFANTFANFFSIRHNLHGVHHKHRHDNRPFQLSCHTNLYPGSDSDL